MNVNEVDYTINLVKNLNETVIDKKRKEAAYWIGDATTVQVVRFNVILVPLAEKIVEDSGVVSNVEKMDKIIKGFIIVVYFYIKLGVSSILISPVSNFPENGDMVDKNKKERVLGFQADFQSNLN